MLGVHEREKGENLDQVVRLLVNEDTPNEEAQEVLINYMKPFMIPREAGIWKEQEAWGNKHISEEEG